MSKAHPTPVLPDCHRLRSGASIVARPEHASESRLKNVVAGTGRKPPRPTPRGISQAPPPPCAPGANRRLPATLQAGSPRHRRGRARAPLRGVGPAARATPSPSFSCQPAGPPGAARSSSQHVPVSEGAEPVKAAQGLAQGGAKARRVRPRQFPPGCWRAAPALPHTSLGLAPPAPPR
jgi:hypothetical protein